MTKVTLRAALLGAATLALAGCVTPYPHGQVSAVAVSDVRAEQPDIPQPVRWGGTIAGVTNHGNGTTSLEIVSRPLSRTGRPVRNDQSDGRFIAEVADVLDPTIIKAGRDITVTGLVGEVRDGVIGESPYRFPVVDVDDYHYWTPALARTYAYSSHCYNNWPHPLYRHRVGCDRFGFYGRFGHRRGHRGHRGNVGFSLIIRP